ncbi:hypothetical protein [Rhizobium acidisoli]|nr:hypothetical protein [Rhizobium acidisoli]
MTISANLTHSGKVQSRKRRADQSFHREIKPDVWRCLVLPVHWNLQHLL